MDADTCYLKSIFRIHESKYGNSCRCLRSIAIRFSKFNVRPCSCLPIHLSLNGGRAEGRISVKASLFLLLGFFFCQLSTAECSSWRQMFTGVSEFDSAPGLLPAGWAELPQVSVTGAPHPHVLSVTTCPRFVGGF